MRFRLILLLLSLAFAFSGTAQELPPAQFLSAPLRYNPGMTGLMAADFRLAISREDLISYQYRGMRTTDFSFDMPVLKGVLLRGDALGIGVMHYAGDVAYKDASGYKNSVTGLSFAYHKGLGAKAKHHISMGAQTIFTNYNYVFKYDTATGEKGHGNSTGYNVGVTYSGIITSKTSLYGGFGRYYSGLPYGRDRYTLFAGGTFHVTKNTLLFANAAYHFGHSTLQLSVYSRFLLNPGKTNPLRSDIALYTGVVMVADESAMPYVGFEAFGARIGCSIDARSLTTKNYPTPGYQLSVIYSGHFRKRQSPPQITTPDVEVLPPATQRPANWSVPAMY